MVAVFIALCLFFVISTSVDDDRRLPIVYVYTLTSCTRAFPEYIFHVLRQAVFSQPDSRIILASNFGFCPQTVDSLKDFTDVERIDVEPIASKRTRQFMESAREIFPIDYGAELWLTSAYRFFHLEDIMRVHGFKEVMHVEADNMLYGNYTALLPVLREHYKGIAATPLNKDKTMVTASVFWIPSIESLQIFNNFLMLLGKNNSKEWKGYLDWLRPSSSKHGGVFPGPDGIGIKPFAINEMTILAHYHHRFPTRFPMFPIMPVYSYPAVKHISIDFLAYAEHGSEVGYPTFDGIWDPNSWGQYLGGTAQKGGRNKGFTDGNHVIGLGMRVSPCRPHMVCTNLTYPNPDPNPEVRQRLRFPPPIEPVDAPSCWTAPMVSCVEGVQGPFVPLWNLHVHSKHTLHYLSMPCRCNS